MTDFKQLLFSISCEQHKELKKKLKKEFRSLPQQVAYLGDCVPPERSVCKRFLALYPYTSTQKSQKQESLNARLQSEDYWYMAASAALCQLTIQEFVAHLITVWLADEHFAIKLRTRCKVAFVFDQGGADWVHAQQISDDLFFLRNTPRGVSHLDLMSGDIVRAIPQCAGGSSVTDSFIFKELVIRFR